MAEGSAVDVKSVLSNAVSTEIINFGDIGERTSGSKFWLEKPLSQTKGILPTACIVYGYDTYNNNGLLYICSFYIVGSNLRFSMNCTSSTRYVDVKIQAIYINT